MGAKRTFGEVIISYCKWADINQSQLARRLGYSRAYMSQLCTGYVTRQAGVKSPVDPSLSTMERVARAMGISFSQLAEMMDGNLGTDSATWDVVTSSYQSQSSCNRHITPEALKQLADLVADELISREKNSH